MPYKNKEDRNRRAKERRKDPEYLEKLHSYMNNYCKKWREKHHERLNKYLREWSRARRRKLRGDQFGKRKPRKTAEEKLMTKRAARRRFYANHREEIRKATKQARIENPERFRKVDKARYARDQEKRIHASRVSRAKRGGQECYLSIDDWLSLLHRFNYRCAYCGVLLTKSNRSLDHKIPLVRGGTNDIENLVPACRPCNCKKNRMTDTEFIKSTKE